MNRILAPDSPALPIALGVALAIVLRSTTLDTWVSNAFFDQAEAAFPGRHSWLLEQVLHDWARDVIVVFALVLAALLVFNLTTGKCPVQRKALIFSLVSMVATTTLIAAIKHTSNIHCPYDLAIYGGDAPRIKFADALFIHVTGAGQCWPSGHAAGGFSLFALFFAARSLDWRIAAIATFWIALLIGLVFTVSQTIRGAHFISHGLWTGIFIWSSNLALARIMLPQPAALEST